MLFNKISNIINRKELLSIDYVPEKIVGRNNEIKDLAFHLSYIFRENPSLPQRIIFGGVGTGKTTVTSYVLKELEKEVKELKDKKIPLKIVKLKGSETRTKYEVLKKILINIAPDMKITSASSDLYDKIINVISERGIYVLIFIDEVHELKDGELNRTLYTVSRLGQDVALFDVKKGNKLTQTKGNVGYILISNDSNIIGKLKENTQSSLTKETTNFGRYSPEEMTLILKSRIDSGALYENKLEEGVLEYISAISAKEGQDSRYALILLSNSAKEAEKNNLDKITLTAVDIANKSLVENHLKQILMDLTDFSLEILLIIYQLHKNEAQEINSKTIFEEYNKKDKLPKRDYSRISQIVTLLEKEDIVYVSQSKKTKMRKLSIEENLVEIENVLKERGKI